MFNNMSSSILVLLSFLALSMALSCSYDYECGNVPYGYCDGGESDCTYTLEGFGITDAQGGSIYYAQQCRAGNYLDYVFKRIPLSGGVPVDIYARQLITAPANPDKVFGIIDNFLYFDIAYRQPYINIYDIDVTNATTLNAVYPGGYPQRAIDLDTRSATPAAYICNYNIPLGNYTIDEYPILPSVGSVYSQGRLYSIPSGENCGAIVRGSGNDLFFTLDTYSGHTTSSFYRGTIQCAGCAPPSPFFTTQEQVIAFAVYGSYIFYGTASGLYRVNLDGTGNITLSRSAGTVSAVAVVNNRVIYNDGMDIRSVDFQGNNAVLLSWNKVGTCTCQSGFTGTNCDACNGQVQWKYTESAYIPVCVPYDLNGIPTSCTADWQCGNAPYFTCDANKCECWDANFSGPHCDVCEAPRQVSWDADNRPKCA